MVPECAWWAVLWSVSPRAAVCVKPFSFVGGKVGDAGEDALAVAGSLVPVETFSATVGGGCTNTLAGACVPVLVLSTVVLDVASALALVGIPEVGLWAVLLKAVAAACVNVPVVSCVALVGKATALAIDAILRDEPIFTGGALNGAAFPSAGASVPDLTFLTIDTVGEAKAFAALVVPVLGLGANSNTVN